MKRAYRVALVCGAAPLLLGVSIFLLWLVTRWEWLEMAGVCTLYGGVGLILLGAIALARFHWLAARIPDYSRRRLWLSTVGCAGLLLVNPVVAGGITAAVILIETCYTVVVHNDSQRTLEGVSVSGGGCDESLGSIPPGGDARRSFWTKTDGRLEFRATSGTTVYTQTIDGYVTSGLGGHATIIVNLDETVSISHDSY